MITRRHFLGYRPGDPCAPPPLHVQSPVDEANWHPAPRPVIAGGDPGPALIDRAGGYVCLGIDPTDPSTWEGRGYYPSTGMISWLAHPADNRRWDG